MKRIRMLMGSMLMLLMIASVASAQYIGTYCFKLDSFADTYIWRVESVGDNAFQITGNDPVYSPELTSINGGAFISGSMFAGNMIEARDQSGRRAIHAFSLNLGTFTGQTSYVWTNPDGTSPSTVYYNLPFSKITCPAHDQDVAGGVRTDPR